MIDLTDNEKKFDKCFKKYGGILKLREEDTKNLFQLVNSFLNDIYSSYPRLPEIHFNIINSDVVNASAGKQDEFWGIGMNHGLLVLIQDLFMKIQSCKSLDYKDCYNLKLDNFFEGLVYERFGSSILSFTGNSFRTFQEQTALLLEFLLYHEVGHIKNGHLGLVTNKFNLQLNEVIYVDKNNIKDILQTIEMDADSFALNRCINNFMLKKRSVSDNENSIYKDWDSFIYNLTYCIYCFFRIFGFYNLEMSLLKSNSHPPAALRISMIMDNLVAILNLYEIEGKNQILEKSSKAIFDAENDLQKITSFDNELKSFTETYLNEKSITYKRNILSTWKLIRPRLEKYAFSDLPK